MPTRNINLTDHFDRFIEESITDGQYGNASEVVREGLRLLEQRKREDQAKLEWLRGAVQEGLDSIDRGEGIEFQSMDDLESYIRQIGKEASVGLAVKRKKSA